MVIQVDYLDIILKDWRITFYMYNRMPITEQNKHLWQFPYYLQHTLYVKFLTMCKPYIITSGLPQMLSASVHNVSIKFYYKFHLRGIT